MLNTLVLIGRLTRDPELRYTSQGTAVTNFGMAVDRGFKSNNEDQTADFFNVVCWKRLAEVTAQNLNKGRLVAVQGRIQSRTVERDGQRRTYIEVVANIIKYLDYKQDGQAQNTASNTQYQQSYSKYVEPNYNTNTDDSDDLPFDC